MLLIMYKLLCGNTVKGPYSLVSGSLPCPKHGNEPTQIIAVQVMEWHVGCENCNYGRWAGQSSDTAEVFASGHRSHNPGHKPYAHYVTNPDALRAQKKFDAFHLPA